MEQEEKMKRVLKCSECGAKIVDNTEKHRHRPKYCPECRTVYTQPLINWRPNLGWLDFKSKVAKFRADWKKKQEKDRIVHNLRISLKREPTEKEIQKEIDKAHASQRLYKTVNLK